MPAGVYSAAAKFSRDDAGEGFKFVLPFPLSGQRLLKTDGTPVKESLVDLYQHGFKACGGDKDRPQRLVSLLEHWTMMVREGHWSVDEHGVAGGIDVFRQAADSRFSHLYRIYAQW